MRAIAQDHNPVEGQARFRTIPVNKLIDGVTITPLCVCRVEAVQHRGLGVLKVGQAQDGLGTVASSSGWLLLHDRWPPCHRSMIRVVPRLEGESCPSLSKNAGVGPSDTMHSTAYYPGDLSPNSRGLASRFNGSAWKASSGQP